MSDAAELSVVFRGKEIGIKSLLSALERDLKKADRSAEKTAQGIGGGLNTAQARAAQSALQLAQAEARLEQAQGNTATAAARLRAAIEANTAAGQRQIVSAQTQLARLEQQGQAATRAGGALQQLAGIAQGAGLALALPALAGGTIALAQQGAQADLVAQRFDALAEAAGNSGDALLGALRKASGGEISDLNLQLAANRANLLGVATSAEQLGTLMAIARDRAQNLGTTATEAFNDLVTGLGRGSPLILDNLGIIVSIDEANKAYAATIGKTVAQLTEAEKKQALINHVVSQGKASLEATGGAADSSAGAFTRLGTAGENAMNAIGSSIATAAVPGLNALAGALQAVANGIITLQNAPQQILAIEGAVTSGAASFDAYQAKMQEVNSQLGQVGQAVVPLTSAQFQYAQSLIQSGTAAATAVEQARALGQELGTVSSAQEQLVASGDRSAEAAQALSTRLQAQIALGGPAAATAAALADGYILGSVTADQMALALARMEQAQLAGAAATQMNALEQLRLARGSEEAATAVSAEATAIGAQLIQEANAAEQAERLAAVKERISGLAGQVSGGYLSMAEAARVLAGELGIAADEAARLISIQSDKQVQQRFADQRSAREQRLSGGGPQEASASANAFVTAQEKAAAASLERRRKHASPSGAGGGGILKAEQQFQQKSEDAEAKHQEKMAQIAEEGAQKRAEAEASLLQHGLDSRADFYKSLADIEDDGLRQQLAARYEAIQQQTAQIAQEKGADAAQAYEEAATAALDRQTQLEQEISQALKDDPARAEYLKGVLELQKNADDNRLRQIIESGSAIANEQAAQYAAEEASFSGHVDRLETLAERKRVALGGAPGATLPPATSPVGATPVPSAAQPTTPTPTPAASGKPTPVVDLSTPAAVDAQTSRLESAIRENTSAVQRVAERVSAVEGAVRSLKQSRAAG